MYNEKIVIVDDDDVACRLLRAQINVLRNAEIECISYRKVFEPLQGDSKFMRIFVNIRPLQNQDILLAQTIRNKYQQPKNLCLIAISTDTRRSYIQTLYRSGYDRVLIKPYALKDLEATFLGSVEKQKQKLSHLLKSKLA